MEETTRIYRGRRGKMKSNFISEKFMFGGRVIKVESGGIFHAKRLVHDLNIAIDLFGNDFQNHFCGNVVRSSTTITINKG